MENEPAIGLKWKVWLGGTTASCDTFKEAVRMVFEGVSLLIAEQKMSWQVLETAVWIERDTPILFYDMRDIACEAGWIQDGKWVG